MNVLVVTNDFPPRPGGIQQYVHALASRLPVDGVTVLTSSWPGAAEFDAAQPFTVVRERTSVLLPTPAVLRRARDIVRAERCDAVWFGAAAPLGLLARRLRPLRSVASTHGHELGWTLLPGARQVLGRIAADVDVVTYLNEHTRDRLAPALRRARSLAELRSGVDVTVFTPDVNGAGVRARHALGDRPTVVCVSRLMPRKGQDVLIRALPAIRQRVPGTALLLVGGGPARSRLERLARELHVEGDVVFTGSVPWAELPAHYAAGDVFAMPCRTRLHGIDVEGLGIVFLEAAAAGLPVVAGRSGGSPEAVRDGETGVLVDGRSVSAVATAVGDLLADPARAVAMGAAGRAWVQKDWRWETSARHLAELLGGSTRRGGAIGPE